MIPEPEGLVFSGHWRDAIPRALIYDPVLDAVAVRVYMYLFTQITPSDRAPFPSYEKISRHLHVSRPTVIRAMHLLRATRWVTQAGEVRGSDGRFLTNIYLIHDEPLPVADAVRLDPSYLDYLAGLEGHAIPRVRMTATAILSAICEQASHHNLPEEPVVIEDRLERRFLGHWVADFPACSPRQIDALHQSLGFDDPDDGETEEFQGGVKKFDPVLLGEKNLDSAPENQVKNLNPAGENEELQEHGTELNFLSDPNSSSSFKDINKTTTTLPPRAREKNSAASPLSFSRHLNDSERMLAAVMLAEFPADLQQELLDELAGQIETKASSERPIRNAIQYLSWMCNQLRHDKLPFTSAGSKFRRARETERARVASQPPATARNPVPAAIQEQLTAMKDSLLEARRS